MKTLFKLFEAGLVLTLALFAGQWLVSTFSNQQDDSQNEARRAGGWLGLIWASLWLLSRASNTVNYVLYHKGSRVYDGITYAERFERRLNEHRRGGKVFDAVNSSGPTFRFAAIAVERERIKRFGGKYNVQHKK